VHTHVLVCVRIYIYIYVYIYGTDAARRTSGVGPSVASACAGSQFVGRAKKHRHGAEKEKIPVGAQQ
jgi:hypothetical protein